MPTASSAATARVRRARRRPPLEVLAIAGHLPHEHDPRAGAALAEHGLGGVAAQVAAAAARRGLAQGLEELPLGQERRGVVGLVSHGRRGGGGTPPLPLPRPRGGNAAGQLGVGGDHAVARRRPGARSRRRPPARSGPRHRRRLDLVGLSVEHARSPAPVERLELAGQPPLRRRAVAPPAVGARPDHVHPVHKPGGCTAHRLADRARGKPGGAEGSRLPDREAADDAGRLPPQRQRAALAANQSTNRDPVLDLDERTVKEAAQALGKRGWARFTSGQGSRGRQVPPDLRRGAGPGARRDGACWAC